MLVTFHKIVMETILLALGISDFNKGEERQKLFDTSIEYLENKLNIISEGRYEL